MAATARKSIRNDDIKKVLPLEKGLKLATHIENNIHALERSGLAGMAAVASNYKQMEDFWRSVCSSGIHPSACDSVHSVNKTLGMGQGLVEAWHKIGNDYLTMCQEAIECRSFDELFNLQRKTATMMMGDWMHELQRASCVSMPGAVAVCPLPMD